MAGPKVVFVMEGPDENDGHLELPVFVEKVRHFLDMLNRSVKESVDEVVVFHVVHLSHSSPATIECVPRTSDMKSLTAAVQAIGGSLMDVKSENFQNLSHAVLSAMEQLAKLSPTKISQAEVRIVENDHDGEQVYRMDDRFKEQLRRARHQEDRVVSTIDGRLEQINIHNNVNTFRIYASSPASYSVNCGFPPNLLETVQSSLGAFVSVSGECLYRPEAPFPYKINVQEMRMLPPSEELPTLSDLYGIAPGATGGMSSERFVRELRDAWGEANR